MFGRTDTWEDGEVRNTCNPFSVGFEATASELLNFNLLPRRRAYSGVCVYFLVSRTAAHLKQPHKNLIMAGLKQVRGNRRCTPAHRGCINKRRKKKNPVNVCLHDFKLKKRGGNGSPYPVAAGTAGVRVGIYEGVDALFLEPPSRLSETQNGGDVPHPLRRHIAAAAVVAVAERPRPREPLRRLPRELRSRTGSRGVRSLALGAVPGSLKR